MKSSSLFAVLAVAVSALALPFEEHSTNVTLKERQQYYSGQATWYYPDVAPGACGIQYTSEDQVVALPESLYDGGSHCGQWITIWVDSDSGNSQGAIVGDLCPTCDGTYGIDLSPALFQLMAPLSQGVAQVSYFFQ